MPDPIVILLAFVAGMTLKKLGYPPLLGYLFAGFLANGFGLGSAQGIEPLAELGITLLLFTIGLKLNLKELMAPQVWGVASLQMLMVIPLTAMVLILSGMLIPTLRFEQPSSVWVLAFALSFSSTVFAVKMFDERGEAASFHAAVAIGILIIQDLIAVIYLVLSSEKAPSLWAFSLFALPLIRPLLSKLLALAGHGELLVLLGICAAIGGAELFELLHLKGGLGALVFGVLLGHSGKCNELYKSLINFKDLFLIGFFVLVGYNGLPSIEMLYVAIALSALIFLRPFIYFGLLVTFKLRSRTALLAGLSLFNYSEFGLIVAGLAASGGMLDPQWVTTLALAMSLSFFIAIPFNARVHEYYPRISEYLQKLERLERLPEEQRAELGGSSIVVLGLGRVGFGAYNYLNERYPGEVIGIEEDNDKAAALAREGVHCIHGDASDAEFWEHADLSRRKTIFVSLSNHKENVEVVKLLKQMKYSGVLAAVSRFPDEHDELAKMGCVSFNLYKEAGHGFAEHVLEQVDG